MLSVVGSTPDGARVLSGVYVFCATFGLPLDVTLSLLMQKGCVPSWEHYIVEGLNEGAKKSTLVSKIVSACSMCGLRLTDTQLGSIY